ncbi:MAG: hypothetical protein JRE28_03895 [Deltaproteobacteria bacterium]|nr:hypothetical protein [Deltaproteobacteria bacterium]
MNPEHKTNSITKIILTVKPDRMLLFSPLLGQGFTLKFQTGISVRDLLCRQINVSGGYLDQRIQTIFLDGKVVDNVDTAVIRQGSTLALSAAMPGLVGATFRRGGAYAAMRSQISHKNNTVDDSAVNGTLVLKLFNLVALELGPIFLKQGIRINGKNLENFFRRVPDFFWDGCLTAKIDGTSQDVRKISLMEWSYSQVFLKLETKEC